VLGAERLEGQLTLVYEIWGDDLLEGLWLIIDACYGLDCSGCGGVLDACGSKDKVADLGSCVGGSEIWLGCDFAQRSWLCFVWWWEKGDWEDADSLLVMSL
jgi:hypothetical protein